MHIVYAQSKSVKNNTDVSGSKPEKGMMHAVEEAPQGIENLLLGYTGGFFTSHVG